MAGAAATEPLKMAHVLVVYTLLIVADHPSAVNAIAGLVFPLVTLRLTPPAPMVVVYLIESAKYAS